MKMTPISIVRVYFSEKDSNIESLLKRLHDREKVKGVTVFRGISGFGESGIVHDSHLVNLSFDLPVVVEFFDEPDKVKKIVGHISEKIKPRHMIWWDANVNMS
ncbi:MAG: DUF190 domain-containing protein [Gammaproteobacteria bacterium]|nr:DUF190 domain-containing protein [Gammaproteobacteria bacterium]